ncbi:uncharacterized protein LOC105445620 [Strongylocentrotus purpuratus]|uniref:Uncharacterized protein n=1 Tax=Strongylocentrotus purpuratus TaxID=7668 RepID=A0A7M7HPM7_STRPU|nr:uncharacterized protein LOC105445620 [Strongylocentrotus purpuratus]|eukprot:XP_011679682.1 PREDICTED: uncharacterized protein LOC105445620 [Strongylocentrotus purpuratus]
MKLFGVVILLLLVVSTNMSGASADTDDGMASTPFTPLSSPYPGTHPRQSTIRFPSKPTKSTRTLNYVKTSPRTVFETGTSGTTARTPTPSRPSTPKPKPSRRVTPTQSLCVTSSNTLATTLPLIYQSSLSPQSGRYVNSAALALGMILVISYLVFILIGFLVYRRLRKPDLVAQKATDVESKGSGFPQAPSSNPTYVNTISSTKSTAVQRSKEKVCPLPEQTNKPQVDVGGYTALLPSKVGDQPEDDGYELVETIHPSRKPNLKVLKLGQKVIPDGIQKSVVRQQGTIYSNC